MIYSDKWLKYYKNVFLLSDNQPEFFIEQFKNYEQPAFFDVECGPGLLVTSILNSNFPVDITVSDSIDGFITQMSERTAESEKKVQAIPTSPADIAKRIPKHSFNVISCLNYRLIFLKDKAQVLKFMFDAKTLLQYGGILILDLINFAKFDFSDDIIRLPEKKHGDFTLTSTITKHPETFSYQLNQKLTIGNGLLKKSFDVVKDEVVSPVSIETFTLFAKETKFSSIQFFSDYKGNAFTPDSDRIICVLKK